MIDACEHACRPLGRWAEGASISRSASGQKRAREEGNETRSVATLPGWTPFAAVTRLEVIGFSGASNLPTWLGVDRGLFAKEGLEIAFTPTRGAIEQMQAMMAGKHAIAITAIDNIVGFSEGQADIALPGFDITGYAGVHSGTNYVVARPEIESFADLKGKIAAVDALQSGYGFVLYRILEDHGLLLGRDYTPLAVGSGRGRIEAMEAGRAHVGLLASPNDIEARAKGYRFLADAAEAVGDYQASVYAARRSWVRDHAAELVAFIRAEIAAHTLVYEDKAAALDVLARRMKLPPAEAEATYAGMTGGKGGFNRAAAINFKGVETALAVRSRYAEPKMHFTDARKYVDLAPYETALASLG